MCKHEKTRVVDIRKGKYRNIIRRRRECLECKHRYTTIELDIKNTTTKDFQDIKINYTKPSDNGSVATTTERSDKIMDLWHKVKKEAKQNG